MMDALGSLAGWLHGGWRWTALALVAVLVGGCASVSGKLKPAVHPVATREFRAGVAKVDITPMPGFPMGGHSAAGTTSRGVWTRLYARALYFEDAEGRGCVLVSCDLWSIPAGLADRVAELTQERHGVRQLGRSQIVLAATHTHQSPGNYSTSPFYNEYGSRWGGFDRRLFDFLAERIASTVAEAAAKPVPARLSASEVVVEGLFRNRSLPAFLLNPESRALLEAQRSLKRFEPTDLFPDPDAAAAVNPVVSCLQIRAADGALLGAAAFLAVHPTAMSHGTEVYQADIFGVAATLMEQRLATSGASPVVALFNGAEGDQSTWWRDQDRRETLALGNHLANHLLPVLRDSVGSEDVTGPIRWRFARVPMKEQSVTDIEDGQTVTRRTAADPFPGVATLGGAEDGRSFATDLGFREGVRGPRKDDQGSKQPALDPSFLSFELPISLTRIALAKDPPPDEVPLGVYSIGSLVLATLPGEFTMVMGRRIAARVATESAIPLKRVWLVGLANEYLSYFTTPEEYEAQHYEGASTLYGPASGPYVRARLGGLARSLATPASPEVEARYKYAVGKTREFGPCEVGERPYRRSDGLANLLQSLDDGRPRHDFPSYDWDDVLPQFQTGSPQSPTPKVTVEVESPAGTWTQLVSPAGVPENDAGLNLVTILLEAEPDRSRWATFWLPPAGVDSTKRFRFRVTRLGGDEKTSPDFSLPPDLPAAIPQR